MNTQTNRKIINDAKNSIFERRMRYLKIAFDLIDAKATDFAEQAARKKRPPRTPLPEIAELHSERDAGRPRSRSNAKKKTQSTGRGVAGARAG